MTLAETLDGVADPPAPVRPFRSARVRRRDRPLDRPYPRPARAPRAVADPGPDFRGQAERQDQGPRCPGVPRRQLMADHAALGVGPLPQDRSRPSDRPARRGRCDLWRQDRQHRGDPLDLQQRQPQGHDGAPRSVPAGRGFELAEFDVFCPKATAGIGGLPDTILDRAIVIPMERRARGEPIEKLRARTSSQLGTPLRARPRGTVPTIEDLTVADAALPAELDDRAQDGWEPLIAIADAAGGTWPARARAAAIADLRSRSSSDDSLELRLLADMRQVLSGDDPLFVPSSTIRERLVAFDASPWADLRGKPITPHFLAKVLRSFEVEPARERAGGEGNPVHGYRRADFVDPWAGTCRSIRHK